MKQLLRNIRIITVLFLLIVAGVMAGVVVQQYRSQTSLLAAAGENKAALRSRYQTAGDIVSADGVVLASSSSGDRLYSDDPELAQSLSQLVGDYTHNITNTIESQYQGNLLGTGRNPVYQLLFDITGHGLEGDSVNLTIDSRLQKYAYQLLSGYRGSIVLSNYETGELYAMVSTPAATMDAIVNWGEFPDTALFNRALKGSYYPASTFKIINSAAWLQSENFDPSLMVDCDTLPVIPHGADEAGEESHGAVDLTHAFMDSCNIFYSETALRTGLQDLTRTAEAFGYNKPLTVDRLTVTQSEFYVPEDEDALLTWAAIGQPAGEARNTVSPLQMALMVGAVANDGVMMTPHIVSSMTNPLGQIYEESRPSILRTVYDRSYAEDMKALLSAGVDGGGGGWRAQIEGYAVSGKTGSAEVEGQVGKNLVFVGYVATPEQPLAVSVLVENVDAFASTTTAPMAGELLSYAINLDVVHGN